MKSVVVTGVSTGIGWGIAKVLLANGFRVYGSVRKRADADRLKAEFGDNFVPLLFDISDEAAVRAAAREVRTALKGETLAGLVNNAGIAVSGPLLEIPLDDFRRQIEINLTESGHRHPGFRAALGRRHVAQGRARADRDDELGRRPARAAVHRTLCRVQARARRPLGEPQARDDAVRHQGDHHRTGRRQNADLGQDRRASTSPPTGTRPISQRSSGCASRCSP